jgi:hypothetical protein
LTLSSGEPSRAEVIKSGPTTWPDIPATNKVCSGHPQSVEGERLLRLAVGDVERSTFATCPARVARIDDTPLGGRGAAVSQTCATKGKFLTCDIPFAADHLQTDFVFAKGKQFAAHERDLHLTSERPDADRVVGDKAKDAIGVRLGGMPTKLDQRVLAIGLLRRSGIGDFGDATSGGLSRQPEFFSRLAIDTFLPAVLTQRTSFETSLRIMLQPALQHSSVSPSDSACSAVRGCWTFVTSLMPFEHRIVLVMFHSTRKERRLPRLKSEASAPCFL